MAVRAPLPQLKLLGCWPRMRDILTRELLGGWSGCRRNGALLLALGLGLLLARQPP